MLTLPIMLCLAATPAALDNTDVFLESAGERALPVLGPRLEELVGLGVVSRVEPRLGVPSSFFALRLGPAAPSWAGAGLSPAEAARRYLLDYAPLYRLGGHDVATLSVTRVHQLGVGAIVVSFARELDGAPLFRDALHVVMTQRRELVAILGALNPAKPSGEFRLRAATALQAAALDALGLPLGELRDVTSAGGWVRFEGGASARLEVARARKVWFGLSDRLEPAWHVELSQGRAAFAEVISARDGTLLSRKRLDEHAPGTYRVWADGSGSFAPLDSPFGNATTPHPTGQRSPPLSATELPSALVTLDFSTAGPRMDPWLPSTASTLSGNNVEAFGDLHEPDGFNGADAGLRDGGQATPDQLTLAGANRTFDFTYDFGARPLASPSQVDAASTQLFFTVNWLHDWLYGFGFDEAAGNGQRDNLGRGGLGGDPILAASMAWNSPDNASMATFGDGEQSRMEMGNFRSSGPFGLTVEPDAGVFSVSRSNLGPSSYDVTAPLVLMAVDGGFDGCGDLLEPGSLNGAVALAIGARCPLIDQVRRAQDGGAVGVAISRTATFTSVFSPLADGSEIPTVGLYGDEVQDLRDPLDAGVAMTAHLYAELVPDRPSALDATIVTHEFGHFLSNRLISDAAGLSIQISRSLGEGWSDFLALMAIVRESDGVLASNANWAGAYPLAQWAMAGRNGDGSQTEWQWFGIRRVPYSLDFAKDGLTFRHIREGASLPAGTLFGGANSEVHNAGEVWTTMLWECFGALLTDRQLPFAQAHPMMMRVFVSSLMAMPANPDFLEARDAVLATAMAEDQQAFEAMFRAFARRGAGPRANAPSKLVTTNAPVIEDFQTSAFVKVTKATLDDSVAWCDRDGRLDVGETGTLRLEAKNLGTTAMAAPLAVHVTSLTRGAEFVGDGTAVFAPTPAFGATSATVQVRLTQAMPSSQLEFRVEVPGSTSAAPTLVTVLANADDVASSTDDFEGVISLDRGMGWRRGDDLGGGDGRDDVWQLRPLSALSTVLFGPNPTSGGHSWVTTPPLTVGSQPLTFRFKHRWDLEQSSGINWDGAYIEVSTDGMTWSPVSAELTPAYSGTISVLNASGTPVTNPEVGRAAFIGTSANYPQFVNQTIAFGTRFANQTVQLRFVLAADQGTSFIGWELDDFEAQGVVGTPFTQRVPDRMACINREPTFAIAPTRRVDERATVDFPVPTDPDGDVLQVTWTQLSGPAAAINGSSFVAPEVTADTAIAFSAVASDGSLMTMGSADFVVANVNRAPELTVTANKDVYRAGEKITLTATATDADGDPLEVTFVQLRGPLAKELGNGTFEAPAAKEGWRLFFEARASDGALLTTAEVDVGLEPLGCGCGADGGALPLLGLFALFGWRRRRA